MTTVSAARIAFEARLRFDEMARGTTVTHEDQVESSTLVPINLSGYHGGHVSTLGLCILDFRGGQGEYEVLISHRSGQTNDVVEFDDVLSGEHGVGQGEWLDIGPDTAVAVVPGAHSTLFVSSSQPMWVEFCRWDEMGTGTGTGKTMPGRQLRLDLTGIPGHSCN